MLPGRNWQTCMRKPWPVKPEAACVLARPEQKKSWMSGLSLLGSVEMNPPRLGGRGRKQPALAEHPVKDVQDIAWKRFPGNPVRRSGFGAIFQRDVEVILEVLADTGQIVHQRDAVSGKVAGLADA